MLRIAPAQAADFEGIRTLLQSAGLPSSDLEPAMLDGFVVLRSDGAICGTAGIQPLEGGDALLRSVAVSPELRGKGYGARLASAARDLASAKGLKSLYLLTTDAASYFASHGFRPIDRGSVPASVQATREFSSLCPQSAIVMMKE